MKAEGPGGGSRAIQERLSRVAEAAKEGKTGVGWVRLGLFFFEEGRRRGVRKLRGSRCLGSALLHTAIAGTH